MPPKESLSNRTCFLVNLRDQLCCINCGKAPQAKTDYHRGFEYHHLLPRSLGGSNAVENLVLLCHDCHLLQHGKVELATFVQKALPHTFECSSCSGTLDPQTVEMNCGWYRCNQCHTHVHLFDHFGG